MWAWVLIFWGFFSVLSTLGIVVYGELEYYLGWFKIISLAVCFFISFLVNVGAFGNGYIGFRYCKCQFLGELFPLSVVLGAHCSRCTLAVVRTHS